MRGDLGGDRGYEGEGSDETHRVRRSLPLAAVPGVGEPGIRVTPGLGGGCTGATATDGRVYLAASNARPAPASSTVRPSRMWYTRLNVGMIFSSWVTTMMAVEYWVAS